MTRSFEAFIGNAKRPVFTFSHEDLAEAYRERMRAIGADVKIKSRPAQRRTA